MDILHRVYDVILDRKNNPREGSYVNYLQQHGIDKICKKIGEEAAEVIVAAKNNSKEEITYEAADLWFHMLVLLAETGVTVDDIARELEHRFGK